MFVMERDYGWIVADERWGIAAMRAVASRCCRPCETLLHSVALGCMSF